MDIRELRTLIAVADCGSFAAAAERLGLSQSTVSLHIRHVEERCRIELFDRSSRPPALSAAGRAFVERAREVVAGYRTLEQGYAETRDVARVSALRIGVIPTLVGGAFAVALARLRASHPGLRVRVQTALSHELEPLVLRERIDCAIAAEPERVQPGFRWSPYAKEPLVVVAPADAEGSTDEDLLRAGPFIRFKRFAWAARLIDSELTRRGIAVESAMEVDSLDGIAGLVAQGLGVSVIPHGRASRPLPEVVRWLPFGQPPVVRILGMLERANAARSEPAEALLAALQAVADPPPDL